MFTRLKRLFTRNRRNNPNGLARPLFAMNQPLPIEAQVRRLDENEDSVTPVDLPIDLASEAQSVLEQLKDLEKNRQKLAQMKRSEKKLENQQRLVEKLEELARKRQSESEEFQPEALEQEPIQQIEAVPSQEQVRPSAPILGTRRLSSPFQNPHLLRTPLMPVRRLDLTEAEESPPKISDEVQVLGYIPGQILMDHPAQHNTPRVRKEHSYSDLKTRADRPKQLLPRTKSFRIQIDHEGSVEEQNKPDQNPIAFRVSESLRVAREERKADVEKRRAKAARKTHQHHYARHLSRMDSCIDSFIGTPSSTSDSDPKEVSEGVERCLSDRIPCGSRTPITVGIIIPAKEQDSPSEMITREIGTPLSSFTLSPPEVDRNTALFMLTIGNASNSEQRGKNKQKKISASAPASYHVSPSTSPSVRPKDMG